MLKAKLPKEVTSYDLVKTFAVLIMIVDHIGFYFYPEALWWRVAGRMCVPVWMFLIGYAKSRDISFGLWNAALLLVVADVIVGWPVLPPNILFTVIVIRLFLDIVAGWFEKSEAMRSAVVAGMVALFVPTIIIFDYGDQCLCLGAIRVLCTSLSGGEVYAFFYARRDGFCRDIFCSQPADLFRL